MSTKTKTDLRNPLAKARDEWKETSEFKALANPESLCAPRKMRVYFENRLVAAFMAGAAAADQIANRKS